MSIKGLTRAQLGAAAALSGQRLLSDADILEMRQEDRPPVQRGCICPNQGKPDPEGFIRISPSCLVHGLKTTGRPNA